MKRALLNIMLLILMTCALSKYQPLRSGGVYLVNQMKKIKIWMWTMAR